MPLSVLKHEELNCLYDKIFHPFSGVETNIDPHVHHAFESIRNECLYYTLANTKTPSYNVDIKELSVIHLNVRSILNNEKFDALKIFLHLTGVQWDIVCVSETWLTEEAEKFRHLDGYAGFFENRNERTGGGVAIYIRNDCVTSCERLPLTLLSSGYWLPLLLSGWGADSTPTPLRSRKLSYVATNGKRH